MFEVFLPCNVGSFREAPFENQLIESLQFKENKNDNIVQNFQESIFIICLFLT